MKATHAQTPRATALPSSARTLPALLAVAAAALLLLLPSGRAAGSAVVWAAPTHPDQFRFAATMGKKLTFTLSASSRSGPLPSIEPVGGLPIGASIGSTTKGGVVKATFRWRPAHPGDYRLAFVAKTGGSSAPVRTYIVRVKTTYPYSYALTDAMLAHWAPLLRPTVARVAPRPSARVITKLGLVTPDTSSRNLVLALNGLDRSKSDSWLRVRLPMLPNNTTGWIKRSDLGSLYEVDTHLFIDLERLVATLERDGKVVFTTRIGVGKPSTPTPRGEFYIRGKLTDFNVPFYGPIVFGTSARSASNTPEMRDWPGDGFVGVHGTSLPELIPGRPSHGCIRMTNDAIRRLAKLMPVGTPVTIR